MGFKTLIDYSKLPLEIAGSGILVRRSYAGKNPDITIKFLKAWIEGLYLFKAKPDFALGVLKKYVATKDSEVLTTIYGLYKEKLMNKPTPTARVAKSMLYLLSRSTPEVAGVNPEGFIEAIDFVSFSGRYFPGTSVRLGIVSAFERPVYVEFYVSHTDVVIRRRRNR